MTLNIYVIIVATLGAAFTTAQNGTDSQVCMPPALTVFPTQKLVYFRSVSDTITLYCGAIGTPTPTYLWQKDGAFFDYTSKPNIQLQSQGSIIINNPSTADAGRYQCFVSNKWGKTATDVTNLQMAIPAVFPQTSTYPTSYSRQGTAIKLPCTPPTSVPAASYSWVISKGVQDTSPTPVQTSKRIQVNPQQGDLVFANTLPTDTQNGTSMYRCSSYNPFLLSSTGGSFTNLVVTPDAQAPQSLPSFSFATNSPATALIGQTFDLACFFIGNPAPDLSWTKPSGSLPTDRYEIVDYGTILRITNVQLSDAGTYQCSATNSMGPGQTTIQLQVEAEPMFLNTSVTWPQNGVKASDGDTVNFTCDTWGIPEPNIVWLSNTQPLNPNGLPGKFSLSSDKKVLTIKNVCKSCPGGGSDLQTIQCNSSNRHGYLYANSYLNVFELTEITSPPQNQALEAGVPTVLSCASSYDASTQVTVTWYFNDQPFVGEPNKVYAESNGNLYFNTPQLANGGASFAGNYTCVVSNGYSSDQASAIVSPVIALRQSSVADYWWVFLIVVVLLLVIIAIFAVYKHLRNNRGDSYPIDTKERDNGNDPVKELLDDGFQDYKRATDAAPLIQKNAGPTGNTLNLASDDSSSMSQYNNDTYRLYK